MTDYRKLTTNEALKDFADAADALKRAWEKMDGENLTEGYPFEKSFDELAPLIRSWQEKQAEILRSEQPKHVMYQGYDYYYLDGELVGQPALASDCFLADEDALIPVCDFIEPLTEKEIEDIKKALA